MEAVNWLLAVEARPMIGRIGRRPEDEVLSRTQTEGVQVDGPKTSPADYAAEHLQPNLPAVGRGTAFVGNCG